MWMLTAYHKYRLLNGWFGGDSETEDVDSGRWLLWLVWGWLEKDVCVREGMVGEGCVHEGRDGWRRMGVC
jgi:hypothetical protein